MPNTRLTPDVAPSQIEKTLAYEAAHTAVALNAQAKAIIGGTRVLSGFQTVFQADGVVRLFPGAFVASGVVVTLKASIDLDYTDFLEDDFTVSKIGSRIPTLILYAHNASSSNEQPVTFGFVTDADRGSLAGDAFVEIAHLVPRDEKAATAGEGRWLRVFGFSNAELARDLREGVQTIESVAFATEAGVLRTNPDFVSSPYFTHDDHLLVFADRWLLTPERRNPTPGTYPNYTHRDIRGINQVLVDASSFDYGGQMAESFTLFSARWGFVVSRDVDWREAAEPAPSLSTVPIPNSQVFAPGTGRLLVFADGQLVARSAYTEAANGASIGVAAGLFDSTLLEFVHLSDIVFREEIQLSDTDLSSPTTAEQDVEIELSRNLYDRARHSILMFAHVTSGEAADGGYIQINREGTARRANGQDWVCAGGFVMLDGGRLRLRDVAMTAGTVVTLTVICVRGSTSQNALAETEVEAAPFYRKWLAVTGVPSEGQIKAFPHLDGFVAAAPGVSPSVTVALPDVPDVTFVTPEGVTIGADFFEGYTLEQGPTFADETSVNKAPREVTGSAAPSYGAITGFQRQSAQVVLTVPASAQAAVAGSPVRLRGGRTVTGLPVYRVGEDRLRVAIAGTRLVPGVDFEEVTETSITLRHQLLPDQYLEIWVE